ncbi:MAG: TIGR04255 family protein [Methylicorpusculum sp.]|uniref:TIGR04255 family protein n=1 Tax=Methylicorpusculum sp. TaxID=2713644 RepID=UPI0027312551|nr:TIGR04255 family protein [Methylicorpusculum sp.]MDP2200824.1 TIGR04255 family protein [Methylicorpusculum sp.]
MLSSGPLPSFKTPPLNEVILTVQYDTIEAFNIATYGLLWEKFKAEFPKIEHYLPVEQNVERIGGRHLISEFPRFKVMSPFLAPPLPRAWFLSESTQELLQIQNDRFSMNWRRIDEQNNEYPHYENYLRSKFLDNLNVLSAFYKENGVGELVPNQCEISYINHVAIPSAHKDLGKLFLGWSDNYDISDIADLEDVDINIKHIVKNNAGEFIGRLHIRVSPAFSISNYNPIYLIELTVRGHPLGRDIKDVISFMDLGREKIVRAFAKITTNEMHETWKIER